MRPLRRRHLTCAVLMLLACAAIASTAIAADPPAPTMRELTLVERAIITMPLVDAEKEISAFLKENPDSDHARFGLGMVQFLRSGENLFQSAYRLGFRPDTEVFSMFMGGFRRLPIPPNPDPEPITYDQFDAVVRQWIANVNRAHATLATVNDADVMLRIKPGLIGMDIDADGEIDQQESFWRMLNAFGTRFRSSPEGAEKFTIAFDRGDVNWLRGYCHLCMATGELMLAYDGTEMFNRVGHLMFAKPVTDMNFADQHDEPGSWDSDLILDWIASIHLASFPLRDPDRPRKALEHLEEAVVNAKEMWRHYKAETDDYFEWVPNPVQTSVIPNADVDNEMLSTWLLALDEAEALLSGKRLMRFWRETNGKGVNLRRVFTEPRRFDLILWVQGSDAIPYLEHGEMTTPNTWARLEEVFEYRIFRHGFWFN